MPGTPEGILPTYERRGADWASARTKVLFEQAALDRFLGAMPGHRDRRPRVLDLGCGSGEPIACYLAAKGCEVVGVDGAAAMVALFRKALPGHRAVHADMRALSLGERYDGIIAWDSYFHLCPDDQRAMFATFEAHAGAGAALLFTTGPDAGEATGSVAGEAVYHASLAPAQYRTLLARHGFDVLDYRPEDPDCDRHTVWLAKRTAPR